MASLATTSPPLLPSCHGKTKSKRERKRKSAFGLGSCCRSPATCCPATKSPRPEDLIPNCDRVMYISVGLQSTRQKQIASYFLKKVEIIASPSQFSCKRFVQTDLHENHFVVNKCYNQHQAPPPHLVLLDRLLLLWFTVLLHLGDLLPPSPAIVNLSLSLSQSP